MHLNSDPEVAVYRTDDHDLPLDQQAELRIALGGNGDWYISTSPIGTRSPLAVRVCTSGGASNKCPRLGLSIASAFHAIKDAESKTPMQNVKPTYQELEDELAAWRSQYPDMTFDGVFSICEKEL